MTDKPLLRREAHPAITHCDNCGCDWPDNGLNPIGCPYCQHIDWRAVNAELLPPPPGEASSFGNYEVHDNEAMAAYARANIARAVAPLQAEIERLQAEVDALLDALRQIAEWPDGGNRYGQENIKRFAQAAIDAAMSKEGKQ